jgi:tetratricopeptide (TPR) repeat protein
MVPHMLGECYFLRAYNHLQMSLIFAPPFSAAPDAPGIIMRTDVSKGATDYKARSVNRVVYNQIIEDLKKAIELLPAEFDNSMPPDYMDRAKKGAAQMLLAKVYYIMGSEYWDEALPLINDLISSDRYPLVPGSELASIFNKIGLGQKVSETIFYTTYYFRNAWRTPRYERHFSKLTNNQSRNFAFSQTILDQIGWNDSTFAQNDLRYQQWATRIKAGSDPTYPDLYDRDYYVWMTKFQPHTSNFVLLRSAELYLMRANMLLASNSAQALEDINTLRDRAGLPALSSLTLRDIENEYLKEMAFEQGSRLLFLQANKLDVPPGDRTGQSAIPYDDPTLVWVYPENETARNPLANEVEGE